MITAQLRGMEHIGMTVPDINGATAFLTAALGAELSFAFRVSGEIPGF
jgi:catechol 2,3-dioxygenase-like lactoylglutathione lyase family enzyme